MRSRSRVAPVLLGHVSLRVQTSGTLTVAEGAPIRDVCLLCGGRMLLSVMSQLSAHQRAVADCIGVARVFGAGRRGWR